MLTRRGFLRTTGTAGMAATAAFTDAGLARMQAAGRRIAAQPAASVAADETYWREIQQAFTLDRTIINLNNGGCCPSPRVVHEALKRYLDISNQAPVYHMWQILEPNIESVRRRLAAEFGCDAEELAITRNASEALQIAQLGIALKAGDEVVTTNQDYGRMLDTWDQRVRRDGIKLTKISFPVPPPSLDDLADRLIARDHAGHEGAPLLPHHQPHRPDLPGEADLRRGPAPGIKTVVDGAHAFAHFPYKASDLGCDYYGTSLHKWLLAPIGTGFLYVRRENIASLWPLTPAERGEDERHPQVRGDRHAPGREPQRDRRGADASTKGSASSARPRACATCAIAGRSGWPRTRRSDLHTNLDPAQSCAIGTVQITGVPTAKVVARLWEKWRIIATPIVHAEYEGVRVTPNVYTTLEEIDTFAGAMEEICARSGTEARR